MGHRMVSIEGRADSTRWTGQERRPLDFLKAPGKKGFYYSKNGAPISLGVKSGSATLV